MCITKHFWHPLIGSSGKLFPNHLETSWYTLARRSQRHLWLRGTGIYSEIANQSWSESICFHMSSYWNRIKPYGPESFPNFIWLKHGKWTYQKMSPQNRKMHNNEYQCLCFGDIWRSFGIQMLLNGAPKSGSGAQIEWHNLCYYGCESVGPFCTPVDVILKSAGLI